MSEENEPKKQPNKFKIYTIAILIYVLFNSLVIEPIITLLENHYETYLFPMFPYTRIALLVIAVLLAKRYIDKRSIQPKNKRGLLYKIGKYTALALVFMGLALGALFSVELYDPTPNKPIEFPELTVPEPAKIETQNTHR